MTGSGLANKATCRYTDPGREVVGRHDTIESYHPQPINDVSQLLANGVEPDGIDQTILSQPETLQKLGTRGGSKMNCIESVLNRRSIRRFKSEPVSEEVLNNILEAGTRAPSATNQQPWHFVVARDHNEKAACSFGGFNKFTTDASFVVVGLYRKSEAIIEKLSLMDVTIALQNMVVAAWVQEVGSCWMGAFDETKLKDTLNLPPDSRIVGAVAFGIPDAIPSQPAKKPLSETVHFDKW